MKRADHRLARLLLVAFTALGVAALHTIGHAAAGGAVRPSPGSAVTPVAAILVPAIFTGGGTTDDGCDGDGCTHQVAQPDPGRPSGAWWDVCLAVLSALIAASVAAVTWRTTPARGGGTTARRRRSPPGAPGMPPAGLVVATTAVLRT